MTNAIDNARKLLQEYDATEYLEADSRDFAHDFGVALRDLLDTLEYEYAVEDYRSPGYLLIGDVELSREDRERYYGTRRMIRRIKAGEWEKVS